MTIFFPPIVWTFAHQEERLWPGQLIFAVANSLYQKYYLFNLIVNTVKQHDWLLKDSIHLFQWLGLMCVWH